MFGCGIAFVPFIAVAGVEGSVIFHKLVSGGFGKYRSGHHLADFGIGFYQRGTGDGQHRRIKAVNNGIQKSRELAASSMAPLDMGGIAGALGMRF